MAQDATDYYLILAKGHQIGAVRVQRLPENVCRVSPIFILPAFQGKGYAQAAMEALEEMYPQAEAWRLDTIKEEAKLCHLYEKLGYRRTGQEEVLQPGMTIVYYEKQKRAESLKLKGQDIHIIPENVFYDMLEDCKEVADE